MTNLFLRIEPSRDEARANVRAAKSSGKPVVFLADMMVSDDFAGQQSLDAAMDAFLNIGEPTTWFTVYEGAQIGKRQKDGKIFFAPASVRLCESHAGIVAYRNGGQMPEKDVSEPVAQSAPKERRIAVTRTKKAPESAASAEQLPVPVYIVSAPHGQTAPVQPQIVQNFINGAPQPQVETPPKRKRHPIRKWGIAAAVAGIAVLSMHLYDVAAGYGQPPVIAMPQPQSYQAATTKPAKTVSRAAPFAAKAAPERVTVPSLSWNTIRADTWNSVVHVIWRSSAGGSMGSGFFVPGGYIVTCYHVIRGEVGPIYLMQRHTFVGFAQIIAFSKADDLALLKPTIPLSRLPIQGAAADPPQVGQPVAFVGYPGDYMEQFARPWKQGPPPSGGLSHMHLLSVSQSQYVDTYGWLHHMMSFYSDSLPGNSGSPVLNHAGRVVGVLDNGMPGMQTSVYGRWTGAISFHTLSQFLAAVNPPGANLSSYR